MIIVDADTILYRVGFSKPPNEESARTQVRTYTSNILGRVENYTKIPASNHVLYIGESAGSWGRYRTIKYARSIDYKAHRAGAPKPEFIEEMKDELKSCFCVVFVPEDKCEADDAVSSIAYIQRHAGSDYCVVGVDKDLLQIAGTHYNYVKDSFQLITQEQADKWFFKQLLMGDPADNIPGIRGVGPYKSDLILSKGTTPQEWWDLTVQAYIKAHPKLTEDELCEMLYERGNLLWIMRKPGEEWYPPIPA